MAKTRIKEVDDHEGLVASLYPLSHLTTVEDLKQLRHRISVLHIGGFLVIQCVEYVGATLFGKGGVGMYIRGHDGQVGCCVELCRTVPQFWEDHQGK